MSGRGASSGEMPGSHPPDRPGRELSEPHLDALLDGHFVPPDTPEELRVVAAMLAELADPAEPGELAGEAPARMAFARRAAPAGASPGNRRRPSWLPTLAAGFAAVLVAATVGLGSVAAAGYAGMLPRPMQALAHHAIGAPPARAAPDTRQAARRLCNAYQHAVSYGPADAEAAAFQKLEQAAGGAGKIDGYCAVAMPADIVPPPRTVTPPPAKPKTPRPSKSPATSVPTSTPAPTPAAVPTPTSTPAPAPAGPSPTPAQSYSATPAQRALPAPPTPTATPVSPHSDQTSAGPVTP
jgi:hypothetical protein